MRPLLDDLELPQVQEISTYDRRMLSEHKPPGMEGSLLQNLGRRPTRLVLWGVVTGADAASFIQKLEEKFQAGQPVPFTADIVTNADIEQMAIDDLRIQELAGKPDRYAYILTLREYMEPVEPADLSLLDTSILDEAEGLIDDLIQGLDIGQAFVAGLERFITPLGDLLTRLQSVSQ
jgi:hypothetical protein